MTALEALTRSEWLYGTWSEALTGETIEFRRDKTVR